jgi:hypothetical protein
MNGSLGMLATLYAFAADKEPAAEDGALLTSIPCLDLPKAQKLDELLKFMGVTNITSVKEIPAHPDNRVCRDYVEVLINGTHAVAFAKENSALLQYSLNQINNEPTSQDKARSIQCSKEEIFAVSKPILRICGQPEDKGQYDVRPALEDPKRASDVRYGQWCVIRSYYYKNIPCRGRYFKLCLRPSNSQARIDSIDDYPIVEPETQVEHPLDKGGAIAEAKRWLSSAPLFATYRPTLREGVESSIEKVIALPNGVFDSKRESLDFRRIKAQYCWEVPFSWRESDNNYEGLLWVSLNKGEVIGGSLKM